ncbi:MAG TPA: hypothetical protein VIM70_19345 [Clostridium sp.]|uniref:hypothetical protein n=1 Tax=Clostridium sp. TaxID=1506 RepID=UPI002F938C54
MRDIQVFENIILNDITTVGDSYCAELILCTVKGIETALIKKHDSNLYFLVNDYKDVYRLIRLEYLTTMESGALFTQDKLNIANKSNIAYIPTEVA